MADGDDKILIMKMMMMMMIARSGARQRVVGTTHLIVFDIVVVAGHDDIFHCEDEDNDIFEWQLD